MTDYSKRFVFNDFIDALKRLDIAMISLNTPLREFVAHLHREHRWVDRYRTSL
jgi:hypothetical protein